MREEPEQQAVQGSTFWEFIVTGFYSGKLPGAPGTWGTAADALIYFALFRDLIVTPLGSALFAIAVFALAVFSSEKALRCGLYGGNKDPQPIVIDEFAGYAVALFGGASTVVEYFAAFVLFRIFDVTKPLPAKQAEKLPGGWGIVMDDIVAGLYAAIALGALKFFTFLP